MYIDSRLGPPMAGKSQAPAFQFQASCSECVASRTPHSLSRVDCPHDTSALHLIWAL